MTGNILNNGVITAKTFTYTEATKTFVWNIGDITEQDIAISYYVYLKGSMEGKRGDGLYDTNKDATITYINYLNNEITRSFDKPKMPWGAAVVNYEFYLVNEEGQPVNSKGEDVPFKNRVKISNTKSVKFNWNNSTNVQAKVVASELVPAGYSLHIEEASYTANAVSSGTGSHVIGGTPTGNAQQSTIMYDADPQYSNSYVAFGVLNKTTLIPDTVVLDYGKPIDIDVMANDRVQSAVLDSVAANNTNVGVQLGDGSTDTLVTGFGNEVQLTNGKATVEGGEDINYYRYQTVNVIPATTVYYEDNFGTTDDKGVTSGIVYTGNWETEGTASTSKQDSYVEGEGVYGSDSSYNNDNQLSGGSAKVVVGKSDKSVTASFKFTGTGFDLISRTNSASTKIVIQVKDSEGNMVKSKILNNLYQSGDLYQIPVYELHDLIYGEYTVVITVGTSSDVAEGVNPTFYLDAIRIYDPLGTSTDNDPNNTDFEEANKQYKADREANASITELRKLLISAGSFNEGNIIENAAVFIDKTEDVYNIVDYTNQGPNNEVYLKKGQSIAFKLKTTGDPVSIQIGAKAPSGNAQFEFGSNSGIDEPIALTTATDMYYDVTNTIKFTTNNDGSKEGIVIITNTGELDNIVSLTNIKITYDEPQVAAVTFSIDNDTVEQSISVASLRMAPPVEDIPSENPPTGDNPSTDDDQSSSDNTESNIIDNILNSIKNWISKWF